MQPHNPLPYKLLPNRAIAVLMVSGHTTWQSPNQPSQLAQLGDLVVIQNPTADVIFLKALGGPTPVHLVMIDVPISVDYPFFA
ncbi:MAG: hypothetical protein IGR92_04130 [Leptolyngbyaceae cyanobacterium T60_A2020_046]|nr:hypothetical protein [Leptolyngbyaceae cyanobacterium T60_A2020_046]